MGIHFKQGVDMRNLTPQTVVALQVADECFADAGEDVMVTSIYRPGLAAVVGLHGSGNALDLAARRLTGDLIPLDKMQSICLKIDLRIGRMGGNQYDVVDEFSPGAGSPRSTGPHLHIEFDPK